MNPQLVIILIGIGFFVALVGIIIIIMSASSSSKKKKKKKKRKITIEKENNDILDLDDLMEIVKDPNTSTNMLMNALVYFNTNYTIKEDNAKKALLFLSRALTHINKNKDIFQYFHRELKPKNLKYINELNGIEKIALN